MTSISLSPHTFTVLRDAKRPPPLKSLSTSWSPPIQNDSRNLEICKDAHTHTLTAKRHNEYEWGRRSHDEERRGRRALRHHVLEGSPKAPTECRPIHPHPSLGLDWMSIWIVGSRRWASKQKPQTERDEFGQSGNKLHCSRFVECSLLMYGKHRYVLMYGKASGLDKNLIDWLITFWWKH